LVDTHVRRIADLIEPTAALARLAEVHTDEAATLRILRASMNMPEFQSPWMQLMHALWLAHYGDAKSAAEALRRAATSPQGAILDALWGSDFAAIRRRPEFKEIVREIGLYEYWREGGDWHPLCRPLGEDDFECS
jgi:hypothetical protein